MHQFKILNTEKPNCFHIRDTENKFYNYSNLIRTVTIWSRVKCKLVSLVLYESLEIFENLYVS